MLTENQRAIRRILIQENPNVDYIDAILGDDNFALAEMAAKAPAILELKQKTISDNELHKEFIEKELARLYSEVAILTNQEAV